MKDAATKSYLKKGQDIVDMNHKAIDIGATAYKKIDVPADWADAQDEADTRELQGQSGSCQDGQGQSWSRSAAWTATLCRFPLSQASMLTAPSSTAQLLTRSAA